MTADVLVVGAGLLGTSVAMALQDAADVRLHDTSATTLAEACARSGALAWDGSEPAGLALVCTPLPAVAPVLLALLRADTARTYSHVGSVQAGVARQLRGAGAPGSRLCGAHPMAGRERGGPGAGRADLFLGRPWVLCPAAGTAADAVEAVRALALSVGADPVLSTPEAHDRAVALISHLPQVVASALAARLVDAGPATELAGPGLQDTTRIAASDPALWRDVLTANAAALAPLVQEVAQDLATAAAALDALAAGGGTSLPAEQRLVDLLRRGNEGRAAVPVKRGEGGGAFVSLPVSVQDGPGRLAALLVAAGEAGVNVEDVHVDHLPGRPRGVIELVVRAAAAPGLRTALLDRGWQVVGTR